MELLAYIQEEFVQSDEAIANQSKMSSVANIESTFKSWLKKFTTKSAKLSLSAILAGTTVLISFGSTLNAIAEVAPSADVRYVQSLLVKNGFDPGAIDGVAGASTKNAIIRAQQVLGLNPDGIAGSQTISALENGGTSTKTDPKVEAVDARGNNVISSSTVMNLQKLLADRGFYNGAVDGIMGAQTRNAIIAAQKAYNLVPDGVAGSITLSALEADGKTSVTPISATNTTTVTKSADVANLQTLLSKRGFYNGAVDGIMGPQTRLAIVAAQRNYGLTTDGIAGSQTLAALDAGISKVNIADKNTPPATTTSADAKTEAKAGDKDVSALQQLLAKRGFYNGAIDGLKGSQTNAAIAAAQRAYGLTADGIAGSQTLAALQKDVKPSSSSSTTANAQAPKATTSNDDEVANLQNLLTDRGFYSGAITGVRGPRTKDAIIAAQKAYGLTPDGIAGAKTIAALEAGAPRQQIAANSTTNSTTSTNVTPTIRVETKPQVTTTPQATTPQTPTPQAAAPQPATPLPQATAQPKPQESPAPQAKAAPAPITSAPAAGDAQVVALQNLLVKRGFYNGKVDGVLSGETRNAIVRAQNFYSITPADGSPSNKLVDSLSKDTFISEGN